jgi:VWFA-related protein
MSRTFRVLSLIAIANLAFAQSVPTNTAPIPTIHAGTHTVYVDVVVRDSQGKLTHGLTEQDFKVFQDGHPQQIRFFLEHNGLSPASTAPAAQEKLSQDEFSNLPPGGNQPGCVNIVLFDLLNTPSLEQLYARRQMLKFLQALPPGQQVALFLLSDKLHMLQGFTSSSDELVRAANRIDPKDFHILRSATQQMLDEDWLNEFAAAMGRDPGGAIEHMKAQERTEDAIGQDIRARKTLDAFAALARASSGYPGRKNLLWLSETFPLTIGAVLRTTQFDHLDTQMLRQTADLIAAAHIAVYPVSLTTLETDGIGAESPGTIPMGKVLTDQFTARQQLRSEMEDIAHETGGKAFYGTNDLARAMEESLVDGASYYSLAYDPSDSNPNQKWDGTYRKIHVELARKGYSLNYRRGYFAVAADTQSSQRTITRELSYAMQPGSPVSTALRMHVRLVRPSNASPNPSKQPHLNCLLNTADIAFSADPDGHHRAQLLMLLVRFNGPDESVIGGQTGGMLKLDFDQKQYEEVVQNGVPFNLEIPFKPGSNYISLGFIDQGSHHIGRLNLSLLVTSGPTASATP